MKNYFKGETVKCHLCGEEIKRGIANILEHHDQKHDLGKAKQALVDAVIEKGAMLTLDEAEKIAQAHQKI